MNEDFTNIPNYAFNVIEGVKTRSDLKESGVTVSVHSQKILLDKLLRRAYKLVKRFTIFQPTEHPFEFYIPTFNRQGNTKVPGVEQASNLVKIKPFPL